MTEMLKFDRPDEQAPIIKVIGVGGGGSNAVSYMYTQGIKGVDFYICNTDSQSLSRCEVPNKIRLGNTGLGAGANPTVGRDAAIQIADEIREILSHNTSMLFITAGMGGGTGTGATPIIAQIAKELGILTVGIITKPFSFEGRKRELQAVAGIEELKKYVDTTLVICNDKLLDMQGDMKLSQAFGKADNVLTIAAKGIAEIITVTGRINVDFEDVKTVMQGSGKAIMGAGIANGPDRAVKAVEMALNSPLLDDTDIKGAANVLLYITSGKNEISLEELNDITGYITSRTGEDANVIWGDGVDDNLEDEISITLIATGFSRPVVTKHSLDEVRNTLYAPQATLKADPITEVHLVADPVSPKASAEEPERIKIQEPTTNNTTPLTLFNDNSAEKAEKTAETSIQNSEPIEVKSFFRQEPEFEILNPVVNQEAKAPVYVHTPVEKPIVEQEDQRLDRISKLKNLSHKTYGTSNVEEMERVPAYMRRNVDLPEANQMNEGQVSRYTLGNDANNKTGLRENNSFLHDNVD
jgi:cell division protein FtsZ